MLVSSKYKHRIQPQESNANRYRLSLNCAETETMFSLQIKKVVEELNITEYPETLKVVVRKESGRIAIGVGCGGADKSESDKF